jgi:hypothetical protein
MSPATSSSFFLASPPQSQSLRLTRNASPDLPACPAFVLTQNEKQGLVEELAAAQQQLAASEAAAADNGAHADERQAAQLQQQLEEARQAVAAAQHAADSAQQRAGDASSELESIRLQLDEAQQQLAAARGAPQLTPMTKLRCQLGNMHASLAQLHAEQSAGRLPTGSLQLEQVGSSCVGRGWKVQRIIASLGWQREPHALLCVLLSSVSKLVCSR